MKIVSVLQDPRSIVHCVYVTRLGFLFFVGHICLEFMKLKLYAPSDFSRSNV